MRAIFVLGSFELGGAERQALLLARYLAEERRAQAEVWAFGERGRAADLCRQHGIPIRSIPPLPRARVPRAMAVLKFALALRSAKPDVILPYTLLPNVMCGLVWRMTGAKTCIWNQRDEGLWRGRQSTERWAVRFTPRFISNSEQGAHFLVHTLGVRTERVKVVWNGISLTPPRDDLKTWRERLGVNGPCFVACMVASLSEFKDHGTLLKAWRRVADQLHATNQEALLLLAGRFGSVTESLRSLTHKLGLDNQVRFLGDVEDVSGLLAASDIGVFSSRSEGCPNGVLECMAAGLPVAATDTAGIRDVVGAGSAGYLAAPDDAESLAMKIVTLATDPDLRARLGAQNRQRVETEFNPRQMCEQTVAWFDNVVG